MNQNNQNNQTNPTISIFTDGGYRQSKNVGAFSYILTYLNNTKEYSQAEYDTTNNIQELKGILYGLRALKVTNIPIIIYSDSMYSLNSIFKWSHNWKKNGWKTSDKKDVKNKELIIEILNELDRFESCDYYWIRGHDGDEFNERCDKLVNRAMDELLELDNKEIEWKI